MNPVTSLPPLQLLTSGQLLALAADSQGWLLIQKPYFAEFVGPGAAVGGSFDVRCTNVYVIGQVRFQAPVPQAERQQAYQQRIHYIEKLQEIASEPSPLSRARSMVQQLYEWCSVEEVNQIPSELIALLIGVLPGTVTIARQERLQDRPRDAQQPPSLSALKSLSDSV